ncbi:RNA methyltransferase PUA domain-containing protein [Candidatus Tisiphia endosymbiont of Parasteatoda lunata]|uniref:RNA methyltransferase PUA domain-containing protein n=1 Tax=Candidatus Tisiphia endosymbiont of Parasteatoda lunata TaxID=3066275 RepID=UPI00313B9C12
MKISRLHRIYTNIKLIENYSLNLAEDHSHYLKTVLRLKVDDHFRIFNGTDGEFIAQITGITKNNLHVGLTNILRKATVEPELTLGISIIKSDRMLDGFCRIYKSYYIKIVKTKVLDIMMPLT